jgi:hypothetical protein
MIIVMGYDFLTVLFLKSLDVVLCHWVLRACLTFQSTRALWSFRTSGSVDPATWHNIAGFFMINSSTTAFTNGVKFRKVNQFITLFNMIFSQRHITLQILSFLEFVV